MTDVITDHANDCTNHRSFLKFQRNSTEMLKFCGKGQIPLRLGSKFRAPRKTVRL